MSRLSSASILQLPARGPSVRRVCRFVGCDASTYSKYVRIKLLDQAPASGCDEASAIELMVLWTLVQQLKADQGHRAWRKVRPDLKRLCNEPLLDLVWEPRSEHATLVSTALNGYTVARSAGLTHVVPLAPVISSVREMWRDAVDDVRTGLGRSSPRHRRRSSHQRPD
jgi:hypothetical protein